MGKLALALVLVSSLATADRASPPPPPAAAAPAAAKAPPRKSVKQMSRAELEQEVEGLRAQNGVLKAKLDEMVAREKDRARRMQKAVGEPASTLK